MRRVSAFVPHVTTRVASDAQGEEPGTQPLGQDPPSAGGTSQARRLSYRYVDLEGLSDAEFGALYAEMGEVMAAAAEEPGAADWASDYWCGREAKARHGTRAYVVRDRGLLVGFLLFSLREQQGWICVLMESGFVRPEYQRRGVGFALCARVVHRVFWRYPWKKFLWVSELINPVILHGWVSRFPPTTETLPGRFGIPSEELEDLAPRFVEAVFPDSPYDEEWSVISGRTTARPPISTWSGDAEIDSYFSEHLNPQTGDSVLFMAAFRRKTVLLGLGQLLKAGRRMLDRRLRDGVGRRSGPDPTDTPA